jgi:hypothetical protein
MWCGIMVDPVRISGGDHSTLLWDNGASAKEVVRAILTEFGCTENNIFDHGDFTRSWGMEMLLPLWLSIYAQTDSATFKIKVVSWADASCCTWAALTG